MGETIRVKTTPAVVLRHAIELSKRPGVKAAPGENTFDRQARTLDELGYAVVAKAGDALGPVAVELPEADDVEVVEDDAGASAGVPLWSLSSGVHLSDAVMAWPDGVDFDGELTGGPTALAMLEQDALKVLAAIATVRRSAARRAAASEASRG